MWVEVNVNDNIYRIYNVHLETTGITARCIRPRS
jgi:hypothetical protein